MTDRERIAELAEILKGRDFDNCIYEDCYDELAYLLVDAGYTRQSEPNPTSLDELKVQPAEPSLDSVEAVAKVIWSFTWQKSPFGGTTFEGSALVFKDECYKYARSILSLFPEPELTMISNGEEPMASDLLYSPGDE